MSALTTRRLVIVAVSGALLPALLPATGSAALRSFGSTLAAAANVTEARQADTAYWQTKLPGGKPTRAPATGQIKSFKVKGIAKSNWKPGATVGGERMFHLQSLRKRSDGSYKIIVTSGAFYLPGNGTNPQKITTFRPINFCVRKGDSLVLNTVGGWDGITSGKGPYPLGTPLQIFSKVSGATSAEYTKAGGTNNGDVVRAKAGAGAGRELLMRLTVGTAKNATALCPGGTGR
jgi:hypothetical protein